MTQQPGGERGRGRKEVGEWGGGRRETERGRGIEMMMCLRVIHLPLITTELEEQFQIDDPVCV